MKGFASPLAKSDYNVNLTKRRISSFVNYLNDYPGDVFDQYLESGALTFVEVPYGEYTANTLVSDNVNDQKNSVYNRKAALERKIEIQSVTINQNNNQRITVNKMIHDFGIISNSEVKEIPFTITNQSDSAITITELINECPCIMSVADQRTIQPGQSTTVDIIFDARQQKGLLVRRVLVIFDNGQSREIAISAEVK